MIYSSHKTTTRTFYRPKIVSCHPNENCSGNDFQSSDQYPTDCQRYYAIISTIHISLFTGSKPFVLVILMPATHFHNNHTFNHSSCSLISYSAEPSLVLFQSVLVSSSLRLYQDLLQHFYNQTMLKYSTTYEPEHNLV